ncbi:hypothetical protein RQP46_006168 [Phenoliferia psychrophenolica]
MTSQLRALLSLPTPLTIPPSDLSLVLASFRLSSSSATLDAERTLSLAILSRPLSPSTATSLLSSLSSLLSYNSSSPDRIQGLGALTALLQVAPQSALAFLQDPQFQRSFSGTVEKISGTKKGGGEGDGERAALVRLLVEAAGVGSLRAQVREQAGEWLESLLSGEKDELVKTTAAVAVIKLRLGREEGMPAPTPRPNETTLDSLGTLLSTSYITSSSSSSSPDSQQASLVALEGISYLTLSSTPSSSALKSSLITPTSPFLTALLPLPPRNLSSPVAYTLATLLHHLTTYPPLTPPLPIPSALAPPPPPEPRLLVQSRNSTLLTSFPLLPTLHSLSTSPSSSPQTRALISTTLHSLIEDRTHRPTLIAAGVAKDLRSMAVSTDPSKRLPTTAARKIAVQALAKLLITAKPDLVFDKSGLLDVSFLLALEVAELDSSSLSAATEEEEEGGGGGRLLRIFECLMALTNVASLGGEVSEKLAAVIIGRQESGKEGGGGGGKEGRHMMRVVESAMLAPNAMVQRAATELVCNLVCTDAGVEFYDRSILPPSPSPPSPPTPTPPTEPTTAATGLSPSLHILIALCASPDLATQLAASGALASLIGSTPTIAFAVFGNATQKKGWETVLDLVRSDADEGLQIPFQSRTCVSRYFENRS